MKPHTFTPTGVSRRCTQTILIFTSIFTSNIAHSATKGVVFSSSMKSSTPTETAYSVTEADLQKAMKKYCIPVDQFNCQTNKLAKWNSKTQKCDCTEDGAIWNPDARVCYNCKPGEYLKNKTDQDCSPCPAGYKCAGRDNQPEICPANHRCPTGTATPIKCAKDQYALKGSATCGGCNSFTWVRITASSGTLTPGFYRVDLAGSKGHKPEGGNDGCGGGQGGGGQHSIGCFTAESNTKYSFNYPTGERQSATFSSSVYSITAQGGNDGGHGYRRGGFMGRKCHGGRDADHKYGNAGTNTGIGWTYLYKAKE